MCSLLSPAGNGGQVEATAGADKNRRAAIGHHSGDGALADAQARGQLGWRQEDAVGYCFHAHSTNLPALRRRCFSSMVHDPLRSVRGQSPRTQQTSVRLLGIAAGVLAIQPIQNPAHTAAR